MSFRNHSSPRPHIRQTAINVYKTWATSYPVNVIKFWCSSDSGCGYRIIFIARQQRSMPMRDIDIANLSVYPSVRKVPVSDENGLIYRHSFFTIR